MAQPETLDRNVYCRGCGYNLRGLSKTGQCPECGAGIAATLANNPLIDADPNWVRKIHRGTGMLGWAMILIAMLPLGCCFSIALLSSTSSITTNILGFLILAWLASCYILIVAGVWQITLAETDKQEADRLKVLRWLARVCVGLGPVVGVLGLVASNWQSMYRFASVVYLPSLLTVLMYGVGQIATFLRLQILARRLEDYALAKSTSAVVWTVGIATGFTLLTLIISFTKHSHVIFDSGPVPLMFCGLIFFIPVVHIWQLIVLSGYLDRLKRARGITPSGNSFLN